MNEITWIEVASDAVKIGLGAFIAGFFAILASRISHNHKLTEEYSRRKRDKLEGISDDFNKISIAANKRTISWWLLEIINKLDDSDAKTDIGLNVIKEIKENRNLEDVYILQSIESRMALLGLPKISKAVEDYRIAFCNIDFVDIFQKEEKIKFEEVEKNLSSKKDIVLTLLAEAYRNS